MEHFVARKAMNIDGFGEAILAALASPTTVTEKVDDGLFGQSIVARVLPPVVRDAMRELKQALGVHHARWQDENAAVVAQALSEAAARIRAQGR